MFQPTDTARLSDRTQSESSINNADDELEQRRLRHIFESIDSFLSLRYCIIHQILPLELKNGCLKLGMVQPDNQKALDYIKSLIKIENYSLTIEKIDRSTLLTTIAAYTAYLRQPKIPKIEEPLPPTESKIAKSIEQLQNKLIQHNPLQDRPTLIISSPEQLGLKTAKVASIKSKVNVSDKNSDASKRDLSLEEIPSLEVQAIYRSSPVEFLTTLSPQLLWRELLGRVLGVRVGKLCLLRQQDCGRILLSHDGIKQLSIDRVDLHLFQSLLTEFKYLAKIPIALIQKDRRGELLRSHKQERTLLCWQISLGQYGEQATLHVLQGKALQFYQQKQMHELEAQAWQLAKTLESKLQQIQTLKAMNPTSFKKLSDIRQTQQNIETYLKSFE
jgi:Type II secretion system (T2SS), protein E, N-terminal domain